MQSDSHIATKAAPGPQADQPSLNQRLVGIGVSRPYASQLAAGKRTPSLRLALEIEAKLGISAAVWHQGLPPALNSTVGTQDVANGGVAQPADHIRTREDVQ